MPVLVGCVGHRERRPVFRATKQSALAKELCTEWRRPSGPTISTGPFTLYSVVLHSTLLCSALLSLPVLSCPAPHLIIQTTLDCSTLYSTALLHCTTQHCSVLHQTLSKHIKSSFHIFWQHLWTCTASQSSRKANIKIRGSGTRKTLTKRLDHMSAFTDQGRPGKAGGQITKFERAMRDAQCSHKGAMRGL